ncbi:hypothetical protein COCCADRAFT_90069 [Bipolaris zeicola 26-R-13]|uniref:Uncharacterized protein n=1 Tax=Cochliobolus carbonum (strain 26-R-13) TaxID=930089 RepID=W6Y7U0_COCC2|nr:uncharacterized protein COCCADRAFT_90069 [Bipolaris zeicola 26-R-13]EUC35677.1 hypothetical protein COCCADRAFT_90069 [Bipolaris zeicola 26-R-13]
MADSLGPLASFKLLLGVSYAVEEVFEGVYILNEGGDDVIDSQSKTELFLYSA